MSSTQKVESKRKDVDKASSQKEKSSDTTMIDWFPPTSVGGMVNKGEHRDHLLPLEFPLIEIYDEAIFGALDAPSAVAEEAAAAAAIAAAAGRRLKYMFSLDFNAAADAAAAAALVPDDSNYDTITMYDDPYGDTYDDAVKYVAMSDAQIADTDVADVPLPTLRQLVHMRPEWARHVIRHYQIADTVPRAVARRAIDTFCSALTYQFFIDGTCLKYMKICEIDI